MKLAVSKPESFGEAWLSPFDLGSSKTTENLLLTNVVPRIGKTAGYECTPLATIATNLTK